jgi:hypothetical protein
MTTAADFHTLQPNINCGRFLWLHELLHVLMKAEKFVIKDNKNKY